MVNATSGWADAAAGAAAAAVCVIHFASEHFAERPAPEAEVARNDTARALENYRASRRDQPPREGAA